MSRAIPLAWLLLVNLKGRLFTAVAGVAFAVVLALVQLAFEDALYTSITLLYSHLDADLVLISPQYQSIEARVGFPERRLYQALSADGVDSVAPLYMETVQWTNPVNHVERFIFLVGFKPRQGVFDLPAVNNRLVQIAEPETVLFDEGSRSEFGPISKMFNEQGSVVTEVSHRRINVVGLFRVGASFANSGQLITSDVNFLRLAPARQSEVIDVGLIKLRSGTDSEAIRAELEAMLPVDVTVLTKQGLLNREKNFWSSSLPLGFIFRASLVMGLIVGAVIVYQILYSGISEHLSEFATLKAIGYSDRRLFWVVLQEALLLSLIGFVPGVLLTIGVYRVVRTATVLPIRMTSVRLVVVYILTAIMCMISGALAVRRVRSADPAEIF
jgi:putative ABC transport system permease protein